MTRDILSTVLAGTLGAGAMLVLQPPPVPPACEPLELVRFVGREPEIHVVQETTWGRGSDDWLAQFEADSEPEPTDDLPPRRRRRHGR